MSAKNPNDPRAVVKKINPGQPGHASGDFDPPSALDQIVQNDKQMPPFKDILTPTGSPQDPGVREAIAAGHTVTVNGTVYSNGTVNGTVPA
jgi:hypothetical protein